ncbi:Uncharacterized protein HSBGL_2679 [Halapricum desulfuricans]|uniref:DUF7573 domain-containing protein n=1 Tax=Halapricum desulfuricans TaxID=2841257 RepID=A0A897NQI5_9EURY|nr:hypothetical protein [Halapricum desulfuricans]QSG13079.1 Uncharacterized protein HSBGL_2679 [Halapricum desulfuricans]
MERDATLEDFLARDDTSDESVGESDEQSGEPAEERPGEPAEERPGESTDERQGEKPPEAVDRAISTMSYRSEGGACAACGSVVERRWRGDDGLVCRDCKSW